MSDRFSQYPSMIPTFNNPNMLQQPQQQPQQPPAQQPQQGQLGQQQQSQQQHQQPGQQLQPQQDGHPNFGDQTRMWQPQVQYRPRSGMDIAPPGQQQTPQMLRTRLNPQNQQLGQQNQQQPQFSLPMNPPMGAQTALANQPQQQPQPFPDSGPNPSIQQPHIPFPNMAPGLNAAQRLGMQNSGPVNRQLELMLAQQTHNGGLFNAAKNQQAQQQQQQQPQQQRDQQQQSQQQLQPPAINHPNADIFSSPALSGEALRRPSPSHPPNLSSQIQDSMQGTGPQQLPGVQFPGAQGMPIRRNVLSMNIQDINERIRATRQAIANHENDFRQILNSMQVAPSHELTVKARNLQMEIKGKQEIVTRLLQQQQLVMSNAGMTNGVSRVVPSMGVGQNPWASPASQFGPNGNIRPSQNGQTSIIGPNGMQPNPSIQTPANSSGLMGVPRLGPPSNPSPQQLGSPFGGVQMNVGVNKPSFMMGGSNIPGISPAAMRAGGIGYPAPLEKARFDVMLPGFLQKRNIKVDPNLLTCNDQQIDLARLHELVMLEGGYAKVNEKEAWNVIGGRMGFVNFPGSDREPPKSGPVVAQQIARIYTEYLFDLEQVYVRNWIASGSAMRGPYPNGGVGGGTVGSGNPAVASGSVGTGNLGGTGLPNGSGSLAASQLQRRGPMLMQYAHLSAVELRQRNLPENIISFVEEYRPHLQRMAIESKRFSQQVRMNGRNAPGMVAGPTSGLLQVNANGMQQHPNQGPSGAGAAGLGPGLNPMMSDQQPGSVGVGGIGMGVNGGSSSIQAQQIMRQQMMMKQQMLNVAVAGDGKIFPSANNPESSKRAMDFVNQLREELKKGPSMMRLLQANVEVPFERQADFKQLMQSMVRSVSELNDKVYMICILLPSVTQRAIHLVQIFQLQRHLMTTGQPRYIMAFENLQGIAGEVHKILSMLSQQEALMAVKAQQSHRMQEQVQAAAQQQSGQPQHLQQSPHPPQVPGQMTHPHPNGPHPSTIQVNGSAQSPPNMMQHPSQSLSQLSQPPTMAMPLQPGYSTQSAPSPSHRAVPINLQPPPTKRKPVNAPTPSNAAPSPAGVSTPVPTNAPTPNAATTSASPSAVPKSPKAKAKKQVRRKASTAPIPQNQNANANAPGGSSHLTPNTSSVPIAPSVPQAPQATQAPEPLQQQGSSGVNGNMKRAREEDGGSGSNVAPSPLGDSSVVVDQPSPPKRAKMEWDGPPSEEMQQRKAMIEDVQTEEDATQFLARMSELFKMAGNDSQQASDFTDLTTEILKGVNQVPGMGLPDNGDGSGAGLDDVFGAGTSLDQSMLAGGIKDDLEQYFDFARLGGEEDDSKTPELVSSSSTTNTSPGSNSGHDSNTETVGTSAVSLSNEVKNEELMDLTYLGLWKELDGGESASYQSNDWKWDGVMTSLDLPWSICNPNMS